MKIADYLSYQLIQEKNEIKFAVYFTEENLNKLLNDLEKYPELKKLKHNGIYVYFQDMERTLSSKMPLIVNQTKIVKSLSHVGLLFENIFIIQDINDLSSFVYKSNILGLAKTDWFKLLPINMETYASINDEWFICDNFLYYKPRNYIYWKQLNLNRLHEYNIEIINLTEQTMIMLKE